MPIWSASPKSMSAPLLNPVLQGEADMTVGIFDEGRLSTDLAQRIAPFLFRAAGHAPPQFREQIPRPGKPTLWHGSRPITFCRKGQRPAGKKQYNLKDCSHVMKEEKQGLWKGFASRVKM